MNPCLRWYATLLICSSVAGGLIVFESWRSRRKENSRREGVSDAIEALQVGPNPVQLTSNSVETDCLQDEVEELKSLLESVTKTHVKAETHAQDSRSDRSTNAMDTPGKEPHYRVSLPTDPAALAIMRPDYGNLVRKRASEVRKGDRKADL